MTRWSTSNALSLLLVLAVFLILPLLARAEDWPTSGYVTHEADYSNYDVSGHGDTSGLQIEVPRDYIKYDHDGAMGRKHLSRVLVDTIAAYLTEHYGYRLDGTSSSNYTRQGDEPTWPE